MGPRSGNLMPSLIGLAAASNAEGDPQAALRHASRALHDLDSEKLDPEDRGLVHHQRAVALASLGRTVEAAAAVEKAREAFTEAGGTAAIEAEQLEKWVKTAGLPKHSR